MLPNPVSQWKLVASPGAGVTGGAHPSTLLQKPYKPGHEEECFGGEEGGRKGENGRGEEREGNEGGKRGRGEGGSGGWYDAWMNYCLKLVAPIGL